MQNPDLARMIYWGYIFKYISIIVLFAVAEKLITPGPNYKNESFKHPGHESAPAFSMCTRSRYRKMDKERCHMYNTIYSRCRQI